MSQLQLQTVAFDSSLIERLCCSEQHSLFALLDSCDEPMVLSKVCELGSNAVSLYRGNAERELMMIAPYLINVRRVEFEWIVEKLDGTPWGYFVSTPRGITLTALRKHFRKFLLVEGPQGEELYFRFYDPRVIVDFLESATPEERDLFFGPIDTIFVNQQDGLIAVKRSSLVRP